MDWTDRENEKYSWRWRTGYGPARPRRLVDRFGYNPDDRVVDLGCGNAALERSFVDYVGVDVSAFIISENRRRLPGSVFHRASLSDLSCLAGETFDLAVCSDCLEHLPPDRVAECLAEIATVDAAVFYFCISTRPSKFKDKDGGPLHLTIWPPNRWRSALRQFWTITDESIRGDAFNVKLRPRKKKPAG